MTKAKSTPAPAQSEETPKPKRPSTWPYAIEGGRLVRLVEKAEELESKTIANFAAHIAKITTDRETGARTYTVAGVGLRGGPFSVDVPESKFNEGDLPKLLSPVAAKDFIDPMWRKFLLAAIQQVTDPETIVETQRVTRPGWIGDRFVMVGRELDGYEIQSDKALPYALDADADLDLALDALGNLMQSAGDVGPVILASVLAAPLAERAQWHDNRYATFLHGRTGSLKTSTLQCFMSIWGANWRHDRTLLKWGPGATPNALLALASNTGSLPLLIDNFKPNTGGGAPALVSLIHAILEGGEKRRLSQTSTLKVSRDIDCWPLFTGEDAPSADAAAIARVLLVRLERDAAQEAPELTRAQSLAAHMPAIGVAWLDFLESDNGRDAADWASGQTDAIRSAWLATLAKHVKGRGVNLKRLAMNLTVNQLTLQVAAECPALHDLVQPLLTQHKDTLLELAKVTAGATAESSEGVRFIESLRELLGTRRALLQCDLTDGDAQLRAGTVTREAIEKTPQLADRVIGFMADGLIYLLPDMARRAVDGLAPDKLNNISNASLYGQLADLGIVGKAKDGRHTATRRWDDRVQRVLPLDPVKLWGKTDAETSAEEAVNALGL